MSNRPDNLPDEIIVRAERGLSAGSPYFSNCRLYRASRVAPHCLLFSVRDDRGRERFIIPNERCAHFINNDWSLNLSGRFVFVEEACLPMS